MAKELEQPQYLRYATKSDQHGRDWGGVIDIRTGTSVGPLDPKFTAPWYPDHAWIRHDPKDGRKIRIDYDGMLAQLREAHREYEDRRFRTAQNMYSAAFHTMMGDSYDNDPPEMQRKVGPPPTAVAFPEAAAEGNKWVLGFTDSVPKWAQAILDRERAKRSGKKYLDADDAADLDEQFDPVAVGGKVEKVGSTPRGRPRKPVPAMP
jgi:hypothetical protein